MADDAHTIRPVDCGTLFYQFMSIGPLAGHQVMLYSWRYYTRLDREILFSNTHFVTCANIAADLGLLLLFDGDRSVPKTVHASLSSQSPVAACKGIIVILLLSFEHVGLRSFHT